MKFVLILLMTLFMAMANADQGFNTFTTSLVATSTPQAISATNVRASSIILQNPASNGVSIFIGGLEVSDTGTTTGIELVPGASLNLGTVQRRGTGEDFSTDKIFFTAPATPNPLTIGVTTDRR